MSVFSAFTYTDESNRCFVTKIILFFHSGNNNIPLVQPYFPLFSSTISIV